MIGRKSSLFLIIVAGLLILVNTKYAFAAVITTEEFVHYSFCAHAIAEFAYTVHPSQNIHEFHALPAALTLANSAADCYGTIAQSKLAYKIACATNSLAALHNMKEVFHYDEWEMKPYGNLLKTGSLFSPIVSCIHGFG
jgi:hypothetical protein